MKGVEGVQRDPSVWGGRVRESISTERRSQTKIPFSCRLETHTGEEKPNTVRLLHYSLLRRWRQLLQTLVAPPGRRRSQQPHYTSEFDVLKSKTSRRLHLTGHLTAI